MNPNPNPLIDQIYAELEAPCCYSGESGWEKLTIALKQAVVAIGVEQFHHTACGRPGAAGHCEQQLKEILNTLNS